MSKRELLRYNAHGIATLASLFLLSMCANPKTAEEFRKAVPGAMFGKTKQVEIKRSLTDLTRMFQRKAQECLNGDIISTGTGSYGTTTRAVTHVVTTVVSDKKHTELVTKTKTDGPVLNQPEEGAIYLVADIVPIDARNSRLEFYYGVAARIVDAIEVWAQGDERGCPDLTRILER